MKRQHSTWKKWIAAALSLSLLAAALALIPGVPRPPAGWLEGASRPVFRVISTGSRTLRRGFDRLTGSGDLRQENRELKRELAVLRPLAREGELAAGENARLRSLLDLPAAGQSLDLTPAWVAARSFDNWTASVTLDKGSAHGLALGQAVTDEAGALAGRISDLGKGWATVTPVTAPGFNAAGQTARSGIPGALEGDPECFAEGKLKLTCLTKADPVQLGETVVTFGGGRGYPSGLTVGTVERLEDDPDGLTRWAVLTPAAEVDRLSEVFVVTGFREAR